MENSPLLQVLGTEKNASFRSRVIDPFRRYLMRLFGRRAGVAALPESSAASNIVKAPADRSRLYHMLDGARKGAYAGAAGDMINFGGNAINKYQDAKDMGADYDFTKDLKNYISDPVRIAYPLMGALGGSVGGMWGGKGIGKMLGATTAAIWPTVNDLKRNVVATAKTTKDTMDQGKTVIRHWNDVANTAQDKLEGINYRKLPGQLIDAAENKIKNYPEELKNKVVDKVNQYRETLSPENLGDILQKAKDVGTYGVESAKGIDEWIKNTLRRGDVGGSINVNVGQSTGQPGIQYNLDSSALNTLRKQ